MGRCEAEPDLVTFGHSRRFVCERFEWSDILDAWIETYERVRDRKAVMV